MVKTTPTLPPLMTATDIARTLGVESHRVEYAIRSRQIEPATTLRRMRVFTQDQAGRIGEALRAIDAGHRGERR